LRLAALQGRPYLSIHHAALWQHSHCAAAWHIHAAATAQTKQNGFQYNDLSNESNNNSAFGPLWHLCCPTAVGLGQCLPIKRAEDNVSCH
jgi:hypothetical protein